MAIWLIVPATDKRKTERGVDIKEKTLFWIKVPKEIFKRKCLAGKMVI